MLAVGKKRERKDYEITEHIVGLYSQSTDCSMRVVRLFCKKKNFSKLAYGSSKYRRWTFLENKLLNSKMFFQRAVASGTVGSHREGVTCRGQNKEVL